jgi:hypothetical protein
LQYDLKTGLAVRGCGAKSTATRITPRSIAVTPRPWSKDIFSLDVHGGDLFVVAVDGSDGLPLVHEPLTIC